MATAATSGTLVVPDVVLFRHAGGDVRAADLITATDVRQATSHVRAGNRARSRGDAPTDVIRSAEREFRYARRLVAAEEMERWLAQWTLEAADWRNHLRRVEALARHGDRSRARTAPVEDRDAWADMVCRGVLRDLARHRAEAIAAAAAQGLPVPAAGRGGTVVQSFLSGAVGTGAVQRELVNHALDWLEVRWSSIPAPDHDAAREVRACLVDDRLQPEAVAARLGVHARFESGWLHRAPGPFREALLEIDVGDARVLDGGTGTDEPGIQVLTIHERRRPSPDDPATTAAVSAQLARRALDAEVNERIRWNVSF